MAELPFEYMSDDECGGSDADFERTTAWEANENDEASNGGLVDDYGGSDEICDESVPMHIETPQSIMQEALDRIVDVLTCDFQDVPTMPAIIDRSDIEQVAVYLTECDEAETGDILQTIMSGIEKWALHVTSPFGPDTENTSSEQRAFRVLFDSTFSSLNSSQSLDLLLEDGSILKDYELVDEAWKRRDKQIVYIRYLFSLCEACDVDSGRLMENSMNVQRAHRLLSAHRDTALAAVRMIAADTCETNATSKEMNDFLSLVQPDAKDSNIARIQYHVRKIMERMIQHRCRRYARQQYQPTEESAGAAESVRQLDSVERVEGIYQSVRICMKPKYVWFDVATRTIVGDRVEDEVVPYSLMVADVLPSGMSCREFAQNHQVDPGVYDMWIQRYHRGDIVLSVACTHPGCCDYMHCRDWALPRTDQMTSPPFQGSAPFLSPSGHDPLLGRNSHVFTPVLEPREQAIVTNGFKKHSSVQAYIRNYFIQDVQAAQDSLVVEVVRAVETWGEKRQWFEDLELNANRHVYAFADGMLVADPELESVPTFYPYESHVFRPGGKYTNLQTVKMETKVCFRPEAMQQMISTVMPASTRCGKCGLPRRECEHINQYLALQRQPFATSSEFAQMAAQMRGDDADDADDDQREADDADDDQREADDADFDQREADDADFDQREAGDDGGDDPNNEVPPGIIIDRHTFQPYRPLRREDCGAIGRRVDLTQFDEILMTQLEHKDVWDMLPADLRPYQEQIPVVLCEIRALLGRLLHRNREFRTQDEPRACDNWQIFLFIKGASGTGKTTILDVLMRLVGKENVGIIDCATWEKQFGLSQVIRADLVAINEVASDVSFSPNTILQMVDGSRMSAPVKSKDVYFGEMQGPLILLGNQAPTINLKAGQWERRQLLLSFDRTMAGCRAKPNMKSEIVSLHLGHLAVALYSSYWSFVEERGHQDIWQTTTTRTATGQGTSYDTVSWIWHHQRARSECHNNSLGRVLNKIRENSNNMNPQFLIHAARDSRVHDFVRFVHSEEWSRVAWYQLTADQVTDTMRKMFGIPEILTDAGDLRDFVPCVAYMPFEETKFGSEDSGHQGFKAMCNQSLVAIQGSRFGTNLPWSSEEDFYRSAFAGNNLHVFEGRLPYPPFSPTLVNARWLIGVTDRTVYQVDGSVHTSFQQLQESINASK